MTVARLKVSLSLNGPTNTFMRHHISIIPKVPCSCIAYTCAFKQLPYHSFMVYVRAIPCTYICLFMYAYMEPLGMQGL